MANLNVNVDGVSHVVSVPGYETMSPADQQHAMQMASQAALAQSSPPPTTPTDTSLSSNVLNGVKSAAQGFGETMKLAGLLPSWVPGQQAIPAAGQALENAVGAPSPNVDNGASSFVPDLTSGKLGAAAGDAGRFIASSVPDMLGMLGSSAIAGPAGAAAYSAGRNLGPTADARAANNGRSAPTGEDVLGALPSTAAQAALAPVGLGKVGIVKGALERLPAVLKPAGTAALAGVEGAANTAIGETGETLGTDKGLSVSPNDVLMGAVGGLGARAASLAPGMVRDAAKGTAERGLLAATPVPDNSPALVDWDNYVSGVRQQLGPKATEFQVQNAAKSQLADTLRGLIADVPKGDPDADPNDIRTARTALEAALRHNNDATALAAQVASLPWNGRVLAPIVSGIEALNAGSSGSFLKAGIGPMQKLGGVAGRVAWPLVSLAHGNVPGAAAEWLFGGGVGSKVGAKFGAAADNLMGLNRPSALLDAMKARQYLQAAGGMPLTDLNTGLSNARQNLNDMVAARLAQQRAGQQFDSDYKEASFLNADNNAAWNSQRKLAEFENASRDAASAAMRADANAENANNNAVWNTMRKQADFENASRNAAASAMWADANAENANNNAVWNTMRKQAAADNAAFNQQPSVAAQMALNKLARSHEMKLQAASMTPDENPQVSQLAADAATAQAMAQAKRTLGLAGAEDPDDALTKMQVGLPPIDPTQVWGPRPGVAGGSKRPSKAPPAPSVSGESPVSPPQPSVAPTAPPAASASRDRAFEYFRHGVAAANLAPPTVHDFHGAVDRAVSRGSLRPEAAFELKAGQPWFRSEIMRPLVEEHIATLRGGGGPNVARAPDRSGVRNPLAYSGAINRQNTSVEGFVNDLRARGQHDKADVAIAVANAHGKTQDETRAAKVAAAKGYVFPKWLMEHGTK